MYKIMIEAYRFKKLYTERNKTMLSNKRFALVAMTVVLCAVLLLTATVFAIGEVGEESKSFSFDGIESFIPELDKEAPPTSQLSMKEKFEKYLSFTNDGKTVSLFSEEQSTELLNLREDGEREALSYDEVLYLIGNTVDLYLTCDEILLDKELAEMIGIADYLIENDGVIECEHPEDENHNYAKMIRDIYSTVIYRLYLLDSGLTRMYTGHKVDWDQCKAEFMILFEGDELVGTKDYTVAKCIYLLSFDDGKTIGDEYNQKLYSEYDEFFEEWFKNKLPADLIGDYDFEGHSLQNDLLIIDMPLGDDMKYHNNFDIRFAPKSCDTRDKVFPTKEVEDLEPLGYFDRIYSEEFPVETVNIWVGQPFEETSSHKTLSDEDKALIIDIIDSERKWELGVHVHELEGRFDLDGQGINYCCDALYNTNGTYLTLTPEEIALIDSLMAKYK